MHFFFHIRCIYAHKLSHFSLFSSSTIIIIIIIIIKFVISC